MNVLIVGSGAREHALAWKLRQSARLDDLFAVPGNPGTADLATNLPLKDTDLDAIVRACRERRVDLAVAGGEEPLAAGLVDRLAVEGIAAFGPARAAAQIESSKAFAKELMARYGIPTAPFAVFDEAAAARAYVQERPGPFVVKADGLAKGKGVVAAGSQDEALEAIDAAMDKRAFGASGDRVVIEKRLSGREVSAHAFTDGETVAHMPFSCDHKPVFDGDGGPNTGGMGAYSPPGWLDDATARSIERDVTEAALSAMRDEGRPYRGVLYPGLMVTDDRGPMVIEFNCRFGDPEAQVLLPRLESDLLEVLWAVANNRLHEVELRWSDEACVGVVVASGGYPGSYETGLPIEGLDELDSDALVFHAGTKLEDGALVTAGGRVLTIAATGPTMALAREKAYRNVERIRFAGAHFRRDIGAAADAAVQAR